MNHNLVSVVVPTYNAIQFIAQTLESVLDQSYDHLEIIVVDDHSTDGTWNYLKRLGNPKIKIFRNLKKGACAARNYGLSLASGKYIQFLDSDDLLSKNKIKDQVQLLLKNPGFVAVCSTNHFYDDVKNGTVSDRDFLYTTSKPKQFLLKLYGANGHQFEMIQTAAWLTPREVIEQVGLWNEHLMKDQDGEFFCRIVCNANGVVYDADSVVHYRKHISGTNIASKKNRVHLESQLEALQIKEMMLKSEAHTEQFRKAMALQYKFIAIEAYPQFNHISKFALLKSNSYGGSHYLPVLGGKIVEILKNTFGWKFAKVTKNLVNRFKI